MLSLTLGVSQRNLAGDSRAAVGLCGGHRYPLAYPAFGAVVLIEVTACHVSPGTSSVLIGVSLTLSSTNGILSFLIGVSQGNGGGVRVSRKLAAAYGYHVSYAAISAIVLLNLAGIASCPRTSTLRVSHALSLSRNSRQCLGVSVSLRYT